jgi:glucose-1-phosphate adenylyltransferase
LSSVLGHYITTVPAQQRLGRRWYTGSADAIFQSLNLVYDERPDYIAVFGADHVYRMDPGQMLARHIETGAGATVAGIRVPRAEAKGFGVISSEPDGTIIDFLEKPSDPPSVPGDPDVTFASMGNYIFTAEALLDALRHDAEDGDSDHDMGGDIIPRMVGEGDAAVYDFAENVVPGATDRDAGYWRDVGTLDAYYEAHTDLVSIHPIFNLYNDRWPIRTSVEPLPPAKFVEGGIAQDSIVGAGTIISGAIVRRSVIGPDVRIDAGAEVSDSVVLPGARVRRGAVVRGAILDKNVVVPEGALVGVDLSLDRARYTVSQGGVVVLGKGATAL